MKRFQPYFEWVFWIASLLALASMNPTSSGHFSFCLFKFLGIQYCPGCGLGHAISFLLHGDIRSSFDAHPLGIAALLIILFRIYQLTSLHIFSKTKKSNYGTIQ